MTKQPPSESNKTVQNTNNQSNQSTCTDPPKSLDILGRRFQVRLLEPDEYTDCDGYMDLPGQTLGIRIQPSGDYNHDTLIHESIHAIDETLSLGLKEKQVHQLAVGILALFKQNPELITWLLK